MILLIVIFVNQNTDDAEIPLFRCNKCGKLNWERKKYHSLGGF